MIDVEYDVVVCGGGIAGIAAALAASRTGAKTCLLEREYALGGLATLGLIVIYLPLCDGAGVQMSAGIAEELLKLSLKYGPGTIPAAWSNPSGSREDRAQDRYAVEYQAAPLMIAAEEALLAEKVSLLYTAQLSAAAVVNGRLTSVFIETKTGRREIRGKAFVDATGDADLCFFAGEPTFDDQTNRRTGWYYSFDGRNLKLHQQTDPLYGDLPASCSTYSGTDIESVTRHCIDGRKMILEHVQSLRQAGGSQAYPLIIPQYHGLRMTRRLAGAFEFSEDHHEGVWFEDAIGMIGNWKEKNKRYSIPCRSIRATKTGNLYAAGRCSCADKSGWDLTRVIPTCAVTGEAAGTAAAWQAEDGGKAPSWAALQNKLVSHGVLLDESLFQTHISANQ